MKLIHWCFVIALFTASFDVFLVFNIGGTLRISQLLLLPVIFGGVTWVTQHNTVLWPRGGFSLMLFTFYQGLLVFNTPGLPAVSVQLFALLAFTVLGIYAALQLYGRSSFVPTLFRWYLLSYVFVAVFGLVQFTMPILHLGGPLVAQWIRHGAFARINGFSYEPSYFATYLVMGWIMLIDLRVTGTRLVAGRLWLFAAILMGVVFFLSTSKTAWLIMILEAVLRFVPYLWRRLKSFLNYLVQGRVIVRRPRLWLITTSIAAMVMVGVALSQLNKFIQLNTFLQGTGINNTASHSLVDRAGRANDTWQIVKAHPWLGLSLGGVAAEVARLHGATITSIADQKLWWGFPVPLDTLAASGIPGFLPFLWFFLVITLGERALMRRNWSDDRAKWLHALIRAMAFEWLILLGDQYLLRVYLWFHVTMLVIVGYNLRYSPSVAAPAAPSPEESLVAA